jgi:hypothetical protein
MMVMNQELNKTIIDKSDYAELVNRSSIYHLVPGWLVITVGLVFNFILFVIAMSTRDHRLKL